jgi:hypothetical protein
MVSPKPKPASKSPVWVVVALTVVVGILLVARFFAAGTPVAFEAETGTLAGCASTLTNSGASGGSAVKFGGCISSGDTSTPTNLDATGTTIPDTNYPIPASGAVFLATTGADANAGTQAAPFKTFTKAMNTVPTGGTIVVRGGQYRDWYSNAAGTTYGIQNKTVTVQAYPHEQVWFDGTDVVTGWTSDGAGHWYKDWNTPSFCQNTYYNLKYDAQAANGPCTHNDMYGDPNNPAAGDPQMAFVDGTYVHEVKTLAAATGNNFFYDWAAKRIYIATNPTGHTIELAARPVLLVMGGTNTVNVKILGIGVKRYATNEYDNQTDGAITLYGTNVLVENSVFKQMAAKALYIDPRGSVARHNVFVNNGYNAIGSNGHATGDGATDGLVIENNYIGHNVSEKFGTNCSASCGQAGVKLGHMDGFTMRNNIVEFNNGHGLWCDLNCTNGIYVNNLVHNNLRGGIMYEVSYGGIIANNLIYNNSQGNGIRLASGGTKVYNNTVVNNGMSCPAGDWCGNGQIWVYDDPRYQGTSGKEVAADTRNNEFVNNILSGTIDMVRVQGTNTTGTNTTPDVYFAAYDYNSYWRETGAAQIAVHWEAPTGITNYTTLAAFTIAKGFDNHGHDVVGGPEPWFVNSAGGDYTVRSTSAAYHTGAAIPADVAAATGLSAAAGQSRGALSWPGGN